MASERQIAANRRNARKSTGPRSGAGKKRASRNAYRHGLTLSITSTAAFAKQLDNLVREIAGDTEDAIMLERARAAAQAELDLAQIRRAKVALIERASALGELDQGRLPSPSRPRCRHKSLTDRLKPSDERCQNCVSWTDTSVELLRDETERFSVFLVE
jgi:hypothetical protein